VRGKIYAGLALIIGVFLLLTAFKWSSDIRGKRDWSTTKGRVIEKHLEGGGRPNRKIPRATYAYEVKGKKYSNDQVFMIEDYNTDVKAAKEALDELGDEVTVHYNPDDPQQAYLLSNTMIYFYLLLAGGIIMILIAIVKFVGAAPAKPKTA
jgi:hypothetical protein